MLSDQTEVIDATGMYALPGFIDPHAHLDYWANPQSVVSYFLKSGTTSVMTDLHDIVGAVGPGGIDLMIDMTRNLPLKFFFSLPVSSPPFPEFDGNSVIKRSVMEKYIHKKEILSLSEVTPWIRLLSEDDDLLEKVVLGRQVFDRVEGHTPGVSYDKLNALVGAGLTSCHEAINAEEARNRLRLGLAVMLRHGSVRSDLDSLIGLVTEEPKVDTRRVMLTPDWKKPSAIIKEGYMDHLVYLAIQSGVFPITAIQMATLNPATYLGLDRKLGGLGPGMRADILLVDDLRRPFPETVVADGKVAVREGECIIKMPSLSPAVRCTPWLSHRLLPLSVKSGDFVVKMSASNGNITVPILSIVNKTITKIETVNMPIKKGQIALPSGQDILKISMLRKDGAGFVTAFLKGFGAKVGGLATSMSHEEHVPMVVGCVDDDMAFALQHLKKIGGGLALVHNGRVKGEIPLPIGGVMSDCSLEQLEGQMRAFSVVLKEMGCQLENPLFTLGFLSFSALPWVRMTPSGLLDVKNRKIIWSDC